MITHTHKIRRAAEDIETGIQEFSCNALNKQQDYYNCNLQYLYQYIFEPSAEECVIYDVNRYGCWLSSRYAKYNNQNDKDLRVLFLCMFAAVYKDFKD